MRAPVTWYVVSHNAALRRRNHQVVVEIDDRSVAVIPASFLGSVVLDSGARVSSEALRLLIKRRVPLVVLDGLGRVLGRLQPDHGAAADLRLRQYELCTNPDARLEFARSVVAGKIHNQHALTQRRLRRTPDLQRRTTFALKQLETRAGSARSLEELRGIEGAASSIYWAALRTLPALEGFQRRDRRAHDLVNALLNYVSALLRETVIRSVTAAGLDPMLSLYHEPFRARPTLVFDLMEEWRPVVLESVVLALIGLGRLTPNDIEHTDDGPRLRTEARVAAIERYHHRVHGVASDANGTYLDVIDRQIARFVAWARRGDPYEPYRWR
ncbi:MAG: CRISPR-associated endonuclease Cas1 [Acidimicrobiales bacterium]